MWDFEGEDGAVYVFLRVDCYFVSVVCVVSLEWEAVLVRVLGEVGVCECDDGWCVFVSL